MPVDITFNIPVVIILIGIFLGCFLSLLFIRKSWRDKSPNLFLGLFIFGITMIMLEGWLNYTGLIFKVLHIANFSEPLNFAIAPLIFLFMTRQLGDSYSKWNWLHALPFVIWVVYCMFFFLQPQDFKYNSIIDAMNLDIPLKAWTNNFSDNPFGIRRFVNELTIIHLLIYLIFTIYRLNKKVKSFGESLFTTTNDTVRSLRNSLFHFAALFLVLVIVKANFKNDVGDYLLFIYFSFMLVMTTYHIVNASSYFDSPSAFLETPTLKYKSSALNDDQKETILKNILFQIQTNRYFLNSNASLSGLANEINESYHNVSQVINERLNKNFFELLAEYRVDEAKKILRSSEGKKLTIEEISERVGYNSKSAFNVVFKKLTSQTPSSYRDA